MSSTRVRGWGTRTRAELGFDIRTEAFWVKGMSQVEEFIDMLEETF